jgi:hypothetical protein
MKRKIILLTLFFVAIVVIVDRGKHSKGFKPWQWIKDKQFYSVYSETVLNKVSEVWLKTLSGPASESELVELDGAKWNWIASCKPHDCAEVNISIFYNETQNKIYAVLHSDGFTYFGDPKELVKSRLLDLHKSRYKFINKYNKPIKSQPPVAGSESNAH